MEWHRRLNFARGNNNNRGAGRGGAGVRMQNAQKREEGVQGVISRARVPARHAAMPSFLAPTRLYIAHS